MSSQRFIQSLFTGETFFTKEVEKEQRDAICPVRVINEHNRIVEFCQTNQEAQNKIKKRNNALKLLGRCPKDYRIITKSNKGEFNNGKHNSVVYK